MAEQFWPAEEWINWLDNSDIWYDPPHIWYDPSPKDPERRQRSPYPARQIQGRVLIASPCRTNYSIDLLSTILFPLGSSRILPLSDASVDQAPLGAVASGYCWLRSQARIYHDRKDGCSLHHLWGFPTGVNIARYVDDV